MIIPKENEKVHYIMTSIKIPLLRKPDGSVIPLTEFISADIELMKDLPEKPDYVLNNEYIKSKIDDLFIIREPEPVEEPIKEPELVEDSDTEKEPELESLEPIIEEFSNKEEELEEEKERQRILEENEMKNRMRKLAIQSLSDNTKKTNKKHKEREHSPTLTIRKTIETPKENKEETKNDIVNSLITNIIKPKEKKEVIEKVLHKKDVEISKKNQLKAMEILEQRKR